MLQTKRRTLLAMLLALAFASGVGCDRGPAQDRSDGPNRDDPGGAAVVPVEPSGLLSDTSLPEAFDGDQTTLADSLGKGGLAVVIVDTICPESGTVVRELPGIRQELGKHAVPVVLVNVDEPRDIVLDHYESRRQAFDLLLLDEKNSIQPQWGYEEVPCVYYFAPNGALAYQGKAVWADLASAAAKSLGLPDGAIKFAAKGTKYG